MLIGNPAHMYLELQMKDEQGEAPECDEGRKSDGGAWCDARAKHILIVTDQMEVVCLLGVLNDLVQPVQQFLAVVHAQFAMLREAWNVPIDVVGIAY